MTKKDYIKLAEAIKNSTIKVNGKLNLEDGISIMMPAIFVDYLCDILKADNSRFDCEQFIEACS